MSLRSVEALEKEIEELEKGTLPAPDEKEETAEPAVAPVVDAPKEPAATDEDKSWAKRYADLRTLQQKTAKELKEAREAQRQPATITEEQVKEWVEKNPKAAEIIKALAVQTAPIEDITTIREEFTRTKALNAITKAHPDFDEVTGSDEFHEWADKQPQNVQNLIFSDSPDDVVWALNFYKQSLRPTVDTKKDAAKLVKTKTASESPSDKSTPVYSESMVQRMSLSDYEKHEEGILAAQKSGNFIYDLSGGAR
jgi:hypothetical protein